MSKLKGLLTFEIKLKHTSQQLMKTTIRSWKEHLNSTLKGKQTSNFKRKTNKSQLQKKKKTEITKTNSIRN